MLILLSIPKIGHPETCLPHLPAILDRTRIGVRGVMIV